METFDNRDIGVGRSTYSEKPSDLNQLVLRSVGTLNYHDRTQHYIKLLCIDIYVLFASSYHYNKVIPATRIP
jgi:hypothetical protein